MEIVPIIYKHTKSYLVKNNKKWIMIDANWPDSLKEIYKVMHDNKIKINDIEYLIVTHFHPDHAGLTQKLKEMGIKLLIHKNQCEGIEYLNNFFIKHPMKEYKPIDNSNNIITDTNVSRKILSEIGFTGEIIYTQGHSKDSICVIIENIIFTGDLPDLELIESYNSEELNGIWKRILSYKINEVYPSHSNKYKINIKDSM